MNTQPHVVIVGGGFGGLSAARILAHQNVKVTLLDRKNYHLFQPLLYQVATAGLSPAEIAYPLRQLLGRAPNVSVIMDELLEVNKEEKWIKTENQKMPFDYLILACGSTYTYFNSPQWETFAPGLKTIAQATEIRRRVFLAFEKAERSQDPEEQKRLLTFVVVGGGPTGVELAGALGEITRFGMNQDFHRINPQSTRIILIEAGPRILPSMSEALSQEAKLQLEQLGVSIWTNSKVSNMNSDGIQIGGEFIQSSTILWAAGVAASPINRTLGVELDRQGRVIVGMDCSIPGHDSIFVIGDQAHFPAMEPSGALPGLAPVAMQQGRFVARNILREVAYKKRKERFIYVDKGQMATIGRSRAVGMFKGIEFSGFVAWLAWLVVHIYYLIGFRNRLVVLFDWAWMYLTFNRGARLIVDRT